MQNPYQKLYKQLPPQCLRKVIAASVDQSSISTLSLVNQASYNTLFVLPVGEHTRNDQGNLHFWRGKKALADYQKYLQESIFSAYWHFLQAYDKGYPDCELMLDNFEYLIINNVDPGDSNIQNNMTTYLSQVETFLNTMSLIHRKTLGNKTLGLMYYLLGLAAYHYGVGLQPTTTVKEQGIVEQYTQKAIDYLNQAASKGYEKAWFLLYDIYNELKLVDAAQSAILQLQAKASQQAYYYLGEIYWIQWAENSHEFAETLAQSMAYFAKAASQGCIKSQAKVVLFVDCFAVCLQHPAYQPFLAQMKKHVSNYAQYKRQLKQYGEQGHVQAVYEQAQQELYRRGLSSEPIYWPQLLTIFMLPVKHNHLEACSEVVRLIEQNSEEINQQLPNTVHEIYDYCLAKLAQNGLFIYQLKLAAALANHHFESIMLLNSEQHCPEYWYQKANLSNQTANLPHTYQPS